MFWEKRLPFQMRGRGTTSSWRARLAEVKGKEGYMQRIVGVCVECMDCGHTGKRMKDYSFQED